MSTLLRTCRDFRSGVLVVEDMDWDGVADGALRHGRVRSGRAGIVIALTDRGFVRGPHTGPVNVTVRLGFSLSSTAPYRTGTLVLPTGQVCVGDADKDERLTVAPGRYSYAVWMTASGETFDVEIVLSAAPHC
jgi:hypothetical protein